MDHDFPTWGSPTSITLISRSLVASVSCWVSIMCFIAEGEQYFTGIRAGNRRIVEGSHDMKDGSNQKKLRTPCIFIFLASFLPVNAFNLTFPG